MIMKIRIDPWLDDSFAATLDFSTIFSTNFFAAGVSSSDELSALDSFWTTLAFATSTFLGAGFPTIVSPFLGFSSSDSVSELDSFFAFLTFLVFLTGFAITFGFSSSESEEL